MKSVSIEMVKHLVLFWMNLVKKWKNIHQLLIFFNGNFKNARAKH